MLEMLFDTFIYTGNAIVTTWILVFVVAMTMLGLSRIIAGVRKIQQRRFMWQTLRHELKWSALNLACTTIVLSQVSGLLVRAGWLETNPEPASWYIVLGEFLLYFFVFDLYFYIAHRTMHIEPLYSWTHRVHHKSIAPNPLSSSSMNPLEGIAEGLIIPIFLACFTVHETTMVFIIPFATLMGLYVHCGYEFMPGWWYRNPMTSWFITPMFHDQHHQYVKFNYGGFTTIWDRILGTTRPQFFDDFDHLKNRESQFQDGTSNAYNASQ
ncbi:sterol desaturase family protein [Haliea sp. E17]|uniref:sterol desaturase family protein n=1 Tax=Haliea sp. E17 TaxID=3401576 RepID=UPI003AAD76D2